MCIASRQLSVLFEANRGRHCCPPTRQIPVLSPAVSHHESHLDLLRMLFFLNTTTADAIRAISFLETQMLIYPVIILCAMVLFFKDGIGLDSLELGLEVANGMTMRTAVGTTTGVGEAIAIVLRLISRGAPVNVMSSASLCQG